MLVVNIEIPLCALLLYRLLFSKSVFTNWRARFFPHKRLATRTASKGKTCKKCGECVCENTRTQLRNKTNLGASNNVFIKYRNQMLSDNTIRRRMGDNHPKRGAARGVAALIIDALKRAVLQGWCWCQLLRFVCTCVCARAVRYWCFSMRYLAFSAARGLRTLGRRGAVYSV